MAQYIDKDRIVAEIEKIIADETESIKSFEHGKNISEVQRSNARIGILIHIRSLLDTLEDENSTHRTPADIESAMQEVEAKSEAYTNAHRGERADDVLSQMRGEYVSEDLEKEIDRAHRIFYDEVGWDSDEGARAYVADWFAHYFANWQKNHMEANRLAHCNSISNEQAELEQKFLDEHLDKYNRMPTFLDAIEYGMRFQKEQMMKNAVECEYFDGSLFRNDLREKYRDGDKVKIVIVKSK